MRICDWSSVVCSSDLFPVSFLVERSIAQLFNLFGDFDAAVGHDALKNPDAGFEPFGVRRILRGLFGGFVRQEGQLLFLELQVPLVHVAANAEDHGDANDDEEETEDETTVHGLTPPFAGRRSASLSWLTRWPSSVQIRSITARRSFTRSEEHTSELQSLMRISYAVSCLK